jgi:diacylglycerol kinase (ATP)
MTPRSILVIVNPRSGRGRALRLSAAVAARCKVQGIEVLVRQTRARGDAARLAQEACIPAGTRPECVVACGGDGTVQEVAQALAELRSASDDSCPVMGLAPAGRCNDFARALGIRSDSRFIARTLLGGRAQAVDLGRVNGRYFCTVLTAGVDAEITRFVDSMKMPLRGTWAYLYGTARVLLRYQPHLLRIEGEFGLIERPLFVASAANTPCYGGAIRIAPTADPTDGNLDLCLIDSVSRRRMFTLLPQAVLGRHAGEREVQFLRAASFRLSSDTPLELWADGERIGTTPATIDAAPAALGVMVPNAAD